MPVFTYKAADPAAKTQRSGTIVADSPRGARALLRAQGLQVAAVFARGEPTASAARRPGFRSGRRHASLAISFIRELSTLLGVGVPLVEAIDTLAVQYHGDFRDVLLHLRDRIAAGASLAEAMGDSPATFDQFFVTIAQVGESSGTLDVVLDRLADFKERAATLKDRVITALIYPAVVLTMAIVVCLFLMTYVVPKLISGLIESGQPIPGITRVVKSISDFLVNDWWLLAAIITAIAFAATMFLRSAGGRARWHRWQLKIPIVGEMIRKQSILRLCVVLSTLLHSGVEFVRAVRITADTIGNDVIRNALRRTEGAVGSGRDIGQSLADTGVFPPSVIQVFTIGQQSGQLEDMLDRLARDYDRQLTRNSARLTAILEPVLILFLVVIVAFIAVATILPMLQAANGVL